MQQIVEAKVSFLFLVTLLFKKNVIKFIFLFKMSVLLFKSKEINKI